ncbi:unnamed protein product, partial [Mesorhabditis spiculigera]
MGISGFEIGSHIGEKSLSDKDFDPLYKVCEDLNVALFIHPWDMHMWDGRLQKYWMPWLVGMPSETAQAIVSVLMGGVLERFPKLRLCFAHGGGSYPQIRARCGHGYRVRPDLCAMDSTLAPDHQDKLIWADSLVHDPNALQLLLSFLPKDQVCLGTDYPFPLGELEVGKVIEDSPFLSDTDRDTLLWGSAVKLFNLDENKLSNKPF